MSNCTSEGNSICILMGADASFLSRVYRQRDGALLTSAEITTIRQTLFDMSAPNSPVDDRYLDKAQVFFDTLQNDDRWTVDDTGYNFDALISGQLLGLPLMRVEFIFTLVDGSYMPIRPFTVQLQPVLASQFSPP